MSLRFLFVPMKMAGSSPFRCGIFEVEGFEILIDFCAVVLVAGSVCAIGMFGTYKWLFRKGEAPSPDAASESKTAPRG